MSSPLTNSTDSQCTPSPPRVHSKVLVCKWDECPETFIILSDLVTHLHEDHVGRKKANYTCEWASCPRKGATQTSRFALITHLRSHTGEKPYDCKVPGCEKSFTRPDSLTKHMKSQHTEPRKKRSNMEEPQRSHKKRKTSTSPEEEDDDSQTSLSLTPIRSSSKQPSHNHNNNHNNNNHNNNNHNNNHHNNSSRPRQQQALRHSFIERQRQLHQQRNQPSENPNRNYTSDDSSLSEPSDGDSSDHDDNNNNNNNDNNNNNNNSNNNNNNNNSEESQQKSFYEKYLVLKAKHRYIRRENELLADEYQVVKKKLKRLRTEKDILLDAVMQQSGIDDEEADGDGDADI